MPAVTVDDITVLPKVIASPNARPRKVKSITTAPQGFEGEGFPVRRAFAGVDARDLDPGRDGALLEIVAVDRDRAGERRAPLAADE